MDIKTFLISPTPPLKDYPLEEVANAITMDTVENTHSFLDDIAERIENAFKLAEKHRIANVPTDKAAMELQAIVANVMAYEIEKHDPEGRIRTLSNILNSAKIINDIAVGVENAVKDLRKNKKAS